MLSSHKRCDFERNVCVCLQEMTAYKKRPKGGAPMGQALAKKQDSEDEEEEEEEEEIDEEDE